ncbi:MAG: Fe-S cluster assembly ATPase SufC [Halobacteria archaeon]|nr:Fe-S cluster assembly ATPase SufC [Halobacteria archaeon]
MTQTQLEVNNLHVEADGEKILNGVDITIEKGEVVAMMGPNGSGKSTLAKVLMGHPAYEVTEGEAYLKGENILEMEPDERARLGLFLAFQYPKEITGVTVSNFLRTAVNAGRDEEDEIGPAEFQDMLEEKMEILEIDSDFMNRSINEGFSGGEKKRMEVLQMAVLNPEIALIDEVDSGLDIDALKIVAKGINELTQGDDSMGTLLITHYQRILDYVEPDRVAVMLDGEVAKKGGHELAEKLEDEGYDWIREEAAA